MFSQLNADVSEWLGGLSQWLNPLYWMYVIATRWWDEMWCTILPDVCA